jgi:hypothetical protein
LSFAYPAICKDYDEHDLLRKLQKEYGKHHAVLLEKLRTDAAERNLKADRTIQSLLSLAETIKCNDAIYNRAKQRHERGNPPGKANTLGDEINWESLLADIPKGEALHVITDDGDFYSVLDSDQFNSFLLAEWHAAKCSEIHYYKTLSGFFAEHYPDIKFSAELEKSLLLRDFVNSGNFSQTHSAVAKLSRVKDFSQSQLNEIVNAAVSNKQIYWIADDSDVKQFLTRVITGREAEIPFDKLESLVQLLGHTDADVGDIEIE